ncbi:MAG: PEP-CTERM sorting domain-containing protein [Gammaproteobacteria bacterium]
MKLNLVFPVLAAVALAFTASSANAIVMHWDPTTGIVSPVALTKPGQSVQATSQSCTALGFPSDFVLLTSCFAFDNYITTSASPNGLAVSAFSFSFTASTSGSLSCVFIGGDTDTSLTGSNCSTEPLTVTEGKPVTIDLSGGNPLGYLNDLVIGFDFDVPTAYGTPAPVPEPGDLGMFGLGLLVIGVGYGWDKRRRERHNKSPK